VISQSFLTSCGDMLAIRSRTVKLTQCERASPGDDDAVKLFELSDERRVQKRPRVVLPFHLGPDRRVVLGKRVIPLENKVATRLSLSFPGVQSNIL